MSLKLIQFPWSTFCMVTREILRYGRIDHEIIDIPQQDRSLPWKLTGGRSYRVPLLLDGDEVVAESGHETQVIAKHLDAKFGLGLFPEEFEGLQSILWRYIENDVEEPAFKLNDIHYREWVPAEALVSFIQSKERRFGPGCLDQWAGEEDALMQDFIARLTPLDEMLKHNEFLIDSRPRFVDVDLMGMLRNFLWSGRYSMPESLPHLRGWFARMDNSTV